MPDRDRRACRPPSRPRPGRSRRRCWSRRRARTCTAWTSCCSSAPACACSARYSSRSRSRPVPPIVGQNLGMTSPGLRERKKQKTRWAIQEHALRLIAEQGYDATTVDQIAAAAEISPSTFFRYFPTKEDLIIEDEYDAVLEEGM